MTEWSLEPTIGEIMREPMVRALMKADGVDIRKFEARFRLVADDSSGEDGEEGGDVGLAGFPLPLKPVAAERCSWC